MCSEPDDWQRQRYVGYQIKWTKNGTDNGNHEIAGRGTTIRWCEGVVQEGKPTGMLKRTRQPMTRPGGGSACNTSVRSEAGQTEDTPRSADTVLERNNHCFCALTTEEQDRQGNGFEMAALDARVIRENRAAETPC